MKIPASGRPVPGRREPLWDRVDRNKWLLAAYVVTFVVVSAIVFDVLLGVIGTVFFVFLLLRFGFEGSFGDVVAHGLPIVFWNLTGAGAAASAAWALFALTRSERWLLKRFGAEFVAKGLEIDTKMALKDMSLAAGMPMSPALYVIENSNVNAFVFSARQRRSVIGVTRGFLDRLDLDEQRAIFANLVARLATGDTIVATGVTALVWPVLAWREHRLSADAEKMDRRMFTGSEPEESGFPVFYLLFGIAFALIAEIFAFVHRDKQLRVAEKADAEGMLLLKDPAAMLNALEKCVRYDNVVPLAGEAFGDLFYCWPGDSTNDEDDPEWHRVARLREVLGVEGHVEEPREARPSAAVPLPPRIAE